jgi:mannose-6-phosphate isomerase-like protein (cupin superfamily)
MKVLSLSAIPTEGVSHNPGIAKQVMLRNGELPHLTQFAQARFAPGQVAVAHAHANMYEVFFVESGVGRMTVDGRAHHLEVGSCVAVEPGEVHELANIGTAELVVTYFGIER